MENIFKNKKILFTGNTGFMGSWLSLWMHHFNAKVLGLSNGIISKPSNFSVLDLKKKITFKKIDIRNFNVTKKEIKKFKPDFIFHLAAEAIVKKSYKDPKKAWQTNTLGTINILETLKSIKKKTAVVIITSDKVYKNIETNKGYKENDILGSYDPYSASKASADLATQSYYHSHLKYKKNINIAIARAGNVIGGGDWSQGRIIPDCVRSWSKKKNLIIRNPNSTRPWQHVLDVLNGYMVLARSLYINKKLNGEIFNFGPKIEKNSKVIDVVKNMQSKWLGANWKIINKNKFQENKLLFLNSNKAKRKLNWSCQLNLKKAINLTTDWYKEYYLNKKNIFNFSINQIKNFEALKKK